MKQKVCGSGRAAATSLAQVSSSLSRRVIVRISGSLPSLADDPPEAPPNRRGGFQVNECFSHPGTHWINTDVVLARPVTEPVTSAFRVLLPAMVMVLATNAAVTAVAVLPVKLKGAS